MSVIDRIEKGEFALAKWKNHGDGGYIWHGTDEEKQAEADILRLARIGERMQWVSVGERLPDPFKYDPEPVFATNGKEVFRASYVAKHAIRTEDMPFDGDCDYDEETCSEYWPEGWYEWNACEETHWKLGGRNYITHWMPIMPLPEPPKEHAE